jgi:catechol 2,3-dioxygenase-like lactoylglutathione lyase family enzyme
MDANLWNLGAKIADVEAEAAFFVALGGKLLIREKLTTAAGEVDYAIVSLGDTRLLLTPKTVFEDALPGALQEGLTHAVFEVAELEPEVQRIRALGTEELLPPTEISATFGRRKIAFFRSPGGIVFEVMEVLTRGAAD